MLPYILIALAVFFGAILAVLWRARKWPTAPKWVIGLGVLVTAGGIVLSLMAIGKVGDALARMSRPATEGTVISSQVVGERSFAPEIVYEFFVDSVRYTGSTDRHVPLFGNKRRTREVAEKEVSAYPPGREVVVFYNPVNPGESTIMPEPRWNHIAQAGLGLFLCFGGIVLMLLPRRTRQGARD